MSAAPQSRPVLYLVLAGSQRFFEYWCQEQGIRPHRPGMSLRDREAPLALRVVDIQRLRGLGDVGPARMKVLEDWDPGWRDADLYEATCHILASINRPRP